MIYGSISHGNKGPLVVFKKDWLIKLGYKKKTINGVRIYALILRLLHGSYGKHYDTSLFL